MPRGIFEKSAGTDLDEVAVLEPAPHEAAEDGETPQGQVQGPARRRIEAPRCAAEEAVVGEVVTDRIEPFPGVGAAEGETRHLPVTAVEHALGVEKRSAGDERRVRPTARQKCTQQADAEDCHRHLVRAERRRHQPPRVAPRSGFKRVEVQPSWGLRKGTEERALGGAKVARSITAMGQNP
jgi:hypothetical protein